MLSYRNWTETRRVLYFYVCGPSYILKTKKSRRKKNLLQKYIFLDEEQPIVILFRFAVAVHCLWPSLKPTEPSDILHVIIATK